MNKKSISFIDRTTIIIDIITISLAFIAYFPLVAWFKKGTSGANEAAFYALGASLLILFIGGYLSNMTFRFSVKNDVDSTLENCLSLDKVTAFSSCDEALHYLSEKLPKAKIVRNTKISLGHDAPSDKKIVQGYIKAIEKALKSGTIFEDVVSEIFFEERRKLTELAESFSGRGSYKVVPFKTVMPCFLNFIILEYEHSIPKKEMLLGWAFRSGIAMEDRAYKTCNSELIDYFTLYHANLLNSNNL